MAYQDWKLALEPKIVGSWNLYKVLPANFHFFIMLPSLTGAMDSKSQANYVAGNTFQDGLAQHRMSKDLRASSLDIGVILDVGYVAENSKYARHNTPGLSSIKERELHLILEYLISTQNQPVVREQNRLS
ncbi:Lovastatin nonaketide synthase [Penicillium angulare]|uniref:Lovastatin nonaketide synthase n=1 Tax=Penicillium angulare TaxID=116970 RepID=A0A9W9KIV2_9EURO|nr:Lovastatin nonaketide synthase [Penicillium angulare]